VKKFVFFVLLVALAGGGLYMFGRWPESRRREQAEQAAAAAQAQLAAAQEQVRLAEMTDHVFMALSHLADRNYGLARDQASRFFDQVQAELPRVTRPEIRAALEAARQPRDAVIAALSQGDPAAAGQLYAILERLRQAAGRAPLPGLAAGGLPAASVPAPMGTPWSLGPGSVAPPEEPEAAPTPWPTEPSPAGSPSPNTLG
jgi:hypothetical protein